MEEKPQSKKYEVDGLTVELNLPKSAFEQQDLYVLLMCWHKDHNTDVWAKIRKIALDNSVIKDKIGVVMEANELSFKVLDSIMGSYIELAVDFFTSRLA